MDEDAGRLIHLIYASAETKAYDRKQLLALLEKAALLTAFKDGAFRRKLA